MANGYLSRQNQLKQSCLEAGERTGFQQACDFISVALNPPECMGKGVLGGEKICRVMEYAVQLQDEYHKAFEPADPEADYWQDRLDKLQRRIYKDKAAPFNVRYPYLKKAR